MSMLRRSAFESRTSRASNSQSQSKIEKMYSEAKELLDQKTAQIEELNVSIDQAERTVAALKAELAAKINILSIGEQEEDSGDEESESLQNEIELLKSKQEQEIASIIDAHEAEVANLTSEYSKTLKEAEEWSQKHIEAILLEKTAQLDSLKAEIEAMRQKGMEAEMMNTQKRTVIMQESKLSAMESSNKIQQMENELSELQSTSREELREIRAKIDECLLTIDLRQREHSTEISKLEREKQERKARYEAHLAVLAEQNNSEKQRIEQAIKAAVDKANNLQRILKQVEKHHERQLQLTLKDIESMKAAIYTAKSRDSSSLELTKSSITQSHNNQREAKRLEQEISLINEEIQELQGENVELKERLEQMNSSRQSRSRLR